MQDHKTTQLRFDKLRLTTTIGDRRAALSWGIRNGYPRLTVYIFRPDENKLEVFIPANMDIATFNIFVDMIKEIINGPNDQLRKIECKTRKWEDGKPAGEPYVAGTAVVGKGSDGKVFITVAGNDTYKPKFYLTLSDWHVLIDNSGTSIGEEASNKLYAYAYINKVARAINDGVSKYLLDVSLVENKQNMHSGEDEFLI